MGDKSLFWVYVACAALLVIGLMLLWYFYMDEIVRTMGWLLVFALVFGVGLLVGRYSRLFAKKRDESEKL